jgi:hypothetical protein
MRIRDIFSQSFTVTIWLGEDEMSDIGSRIRLMNFAVVTILEVHGRRTLEAALGVDVSAWRESDHDDDELEDFFFSRDVLFFDDEWWADSDDDSEFGPRIFAILSVWHSFASFRIRTGLACG